MNLQDLVDQNEASKSEARQLPGALFYIKWVTVGLDVGAGPSVMGQCR